MSIVHDSPDARVVLFTFRPGQGVPLHRTPSAVTLRVIRGRGILTRLDAQRTVWEGSKIAIAPHEAYAVRADDRETLTVLVTISPSPRVR